MRKISVRLAVAVVLLIAGCVTGPAAKVRVSESPVSEPRWQPLFKGVDYFEYHERAPHPLAVHAVRIDLAAPGIAFLVTPSNGDTPLDTDGLKTSTFLEKYGCQVAINASYFDPVEQAEGAPKNIIGLSMSRGEVYSKYEARDELRAMSLLISKESRAWFASPPPDTSGAYNAVQGSIQLIGDGKILAGTYNPAREMTRHPLTAIGLDGNGRFMYWLVIDGRQPGYSEGVNTLEMADWLKWLGAHDAALFDGGGSTTLVVEDSHGRSKVMNRPIHDGVPGTERVNGNHLGLYAQPLD